MAKHAAEVSDQEKGERVFSFTDKEIYVLQAALERFADIDDSEFDNVTKMASELYARFPRVPVKWDDVASYDEEDEDEEDSEIIY